MAEVGGGAGGCFARLGEVEPLAPVKGEGGFTMPAIGVRVRIGFVIIGGSFQFSPVFFGGGGRSAILEKVALVGGRPWLY